MVKRLDRITLGPEVGVDVRDDVFYAFGREPWLRIENVPLPALVGRFVEITYRLSFWDAPARPVFRFWQGTRYVDRIAAAPIAGRAVWVGRVPVGTDRISVSPTNRPGPFNFAVERITRRWWPGLVIDGLRSHPRPARSAILTKMIGWGPESDVNLAWAIGSTPFSAFPCWWKSHERAVDLEVFDRPRFDWSASPPIRLIIVPNGDGAALRRTIDSLKCQIFSFWQAIILGDRPSADDPRQRTATLDEAEALIEAETKGTLSAVLRAGEMLLPAALALVAECAERYRDVTLLYGDAVGTSANETAGPIFRPGWSPRLQRARPYLSGPLFIRNLKAWDRSDRHRFLETGNCPQEVLADLDARNIEPLHRFVSEVERSASIATSNRDQVASNSRATASIIIPTRDHPAHLARIVDSIRARSRRGSFRITIVDNGSTTVETLALLDKLRSADDVQVIEHRGPFNFSLICNRAAAVADTDVLVFLNDDMEVLSEGWLDTLIARALDPTIGAVGARLTYPDGRLQHVGVVVGMGESAGHFGALAAGDDPGWLGRHEVLHEVSAVTGACLAVAREKFEAVGGFDAEHLPIELSDIDLCLKLNARGWQTVVDPSVHLLHEESASRGGATFRRLDVHDRERAIFVDRWRHVIRDDPFFHPGLSLYRWRPALG